VNTPQHHAPSPGSNFPLHFLNPHRTLGVMRLSPALPLLLAALCIPLAAPAADAVFDRPLAELMGSETFRAAGLERLSETELAVLQGWLERHASQRTATLADAAVKAEVRRQAKEQGVTLFDTPTEKRFESRIPGRFEGITGRGQLIELENGQTWRVTQNFSRRIILRSPEATLRAAAMGDGYLMTIRGLGEDIRVERVK
jgi:hypothetical protein